MPPRILRDVLVVDRSALAGNMYQLLFTPQNRFRLRFSNEFESLFKRSRRLRPDLLVVNSNALARDGKTEFPCPAILICSRDRIDLKEALMEAGGVVLIEKPFYPYDLISVANRLLGEPKKRMRMRRRVKIHG